MATGASLSARKRENVAPGYAAEPAQSKCHTSVCCRTRLGVGSLSEETEVQQDDLLMEVNAQILD